MQKFASRQRKMGVIKQNSEKKNTTACLCRRKDDLPRSRATPERARWRSRSCLSIFNHSSSHYDCWNRTDLKRAACYLGPAVAPLWIPLRDKHLHYHNKRSSESKKVAITGSNSQLVRPFLRVRPALFSSNFFFLCKKKEQLCFWSHLKASISACI